MAAAAGDRSDLFVSYAREDSEFTAGLTKALVAGGKEVWIDVEDIRGGASDWRATVWAGIESATAMVFVLTPDSLDSTVCNEELGRAEELNKRIVPVLHRSVDGLSVPPALERPNWVYAREEDDFERSVQTLVDALELDEAWVERHARITQRMLEWLANDRDGAYLLRGSDLRRAEDWLDEQESHKEKPTAEQVTYITASRRASARRQRALLGGVATALAVTIVLAVVALLARQNAIRNEKTARAQAFAAQSIAALSRDPEESVRDALKAVAIRPHDPQAVYALRRAVSLAGWTSILRTAAGLRDVEFSDDGTRVGTGGADGKAAVWDARTGRRLAVASTPGAVNTVQFSPDGRRVLTASDGGLAATWDASTGRRLRRFPTGSDEAFAATWGAGGRRILTTSPAGGVVWDAARGRPLARVGRRTDYPASVRMSLNGRRVLAGRADGSAVLTELATGRRTTLRGKGAREPVTLSLLSADGRRAAVFREQGGFCVWDTGRRRPPFCRPDHPVTDDDLSRDGRRVLRADDRFVDVWDTRSRRLLAHLPNGGTIVTAQFDRTGDLVVTGTDDGVARVWQVTPMRRIAVLRGHTRGVTRARFSPDGTRVATVSDDGSGRLWPAPVTPADPRWQSAIGASFAARPRPRDVLVVRSRPDGLAQAAVWNTDTGRIVPLKGGMSVSDEPTWPCGRAAGCSPWSPDGRFVAGVDADGDAVVWNARTGAARPVGKAPDPVLGSAFSPDGRLVVFADDARRARIWDDPTGAPRMGPLVPSRGAADGLYSAQFVRGPLRVLSVDVNDRARLSDPARGRSVLLPGDVLPPSVATSDDGRVVALGTTDGKLVIVSGGRTRSRDQDETDAVVSAVAVDPAGTAIVTGGQRGTAYAWDVPTLTRTVLSAPGGRVTGAAIGGPDGDVVLVTAGPTARVWDRRLARVILDLPRSPGVRAELSPDGRRIALAGATRVEVLRCDACLPLEDLERRARSLLPSEE